MSDLDEVSQAIGKLQGKMDAIADSQKQRMDTIEDSQKVIFKKLDEIRKDFANQKVDVATLSGKVGLVTAVITYGLFEGILKYIKQ